MTDETNSDVHDCPVKICDVEDLPTHILMCRTHWYMIPSLLRNDINRLWRDEPLSRNYLRARQRGIESVNRQFLV